MGGGHSPNDLGPYSDGCNFFGASDINFFGAIPYLMKRPIILTIKKKAQNDFALSSDLLTFGLWWSTRGSWAQDLDEGGQGPKDADWGAFERGLEQSGGSALENSFSGPNCLPTPMRLTRVKIG